MQDEHDKEWEPGEVLKEALGGLPLDAEMSHGEGLAKLLVGLRPHAEEALKTLDRLERRRGLSDRERTRAQALRTLRAAAREAG